MNSDLLDIKDALIKTELGAIIINSNYKDLFKKKFFEEKIKEGKCYDIYIVVFIAIKMLI